MAVASLRGSSPLTKKNHSLKEIFTLLGSNLSEEGNSPSQELVAKLEE